MSFGGDLPIYSSSVVGFAMWHLLRGDTVDDVRARVEANYRFATVPQAVINASIGQAVINADATMRARAANEGETLANQFFRFVPTGEAVGVRVVMVLQFPTGRAERISVVIQARDTATIAEALAAATDFVDSGGLSTRTGRAYVGTVVSSEIAQVIEGRPANPAVVI